eukprot:1158507-Pelagomonas_calceolata.AAC.7
MGEKAQLWRVLLLPLKAAPHQAVPTPCLWHAQTHEHDVLKRFLQTFGVFRYVESSTTTGATSRSFTSTATNVSTKTIKQLERLERNPKAKVGPACKAVNIGHVFLALCAKP